MTTRNGGLVGYRISLGLTRPSLQLIIPVKVSHHSGAK